MCNLLEKNIESFRGKRDFLVGCAYSYIFDFFSVCLLYNFSWIFWFFCVVYCLRRYDLSINDIILIKIFFFTSTKFLYTIWQREVSFTLLLAHSCKHHYYCYHLSEFCLFVYVKMLFSHFTRILCIFNSHGFTQKHIWNEI